jgi:hypothetical protein
VFGIVVEKPIQLERPKGFLAHDPKDCGVGLVIQDHTPQQRSKEVGVEANQPLQILAVFFPDILPQLGVPAPASLEVLQGDQIVEANRAQLFFDPTF